MKIEEFLEMLDAIRYETEIDDEKVLELKAYAKRYFSTFRQVVDLAREAGMLD